jgi:hypothetical protein
VKKHLPPFFIFYLPSGVVVVSLLPVVFPLFPVVVWLEARVVHPQPRPRDNTKKDLIF